MVVGRKTWVVPEGFIPSGSHGPEPAMQSHDTLSIINLNPTPASLELTIYFSDQDPVGPYHFEVPASRTKHLRLNDLDDPQPVPRDTDYASLLQSDVPVVVQYTRLDSRQAENALLTTMAFPGEN